MPHCRVYYYTYHPMAIMLSVISAAALPTVQVVCMAAQALMLFGLAYLVVRQ